ncbi:MAG: aldo/keto reductase [Steroidobacteraceae bacterium]|jgi:aryl-alcohol dehydrogenase-like predicted oxidoreductase|nr:aldo/keto reductase [Steroidobacteraceae bacterium]
MERLSRRRFTEAATLAVFGASLAGPRVASGRAAAPAPASAPAGSQGAVASAGVALRPLGRAGLRVPGVGIGTNNFGGRLDAAGTARVVDAAMALGANFFDTADVYGNGLSEEYLGKALGARRARAIIATKLGSPMRGSPFPEGGASRGAIVHAAEQSLRRLGTDYIDLYQVHRPDPKTPIEETLRAFDDLVRQGKVRYIGNSNFDAAQVEAAATVSRDARLAAFTSAQNHYSLLTRGIERDLVPACERHGLGILPYFPLESGLLTGKYKRDQAPPEGTRLGAFAKQNPAGVARFLNDANLAKVEKLQAIADAHGHTLLDMAFGWLLSRPYVGSVIAGATRPEQVEANVAAAAWRPTAEVARQIDEATMPRAA